MRNKTGNSVLYLATVHDFKYYEIIKLLRNRIDNSVVNLTIVWAQRFASKTTISPMADHK